MTPRSGPGGAGSDPRGPKTTPRAPQERPKSRPEAVSEQPWWPPGADLAPKRLPEPSGEAFWPPSGGGFWPLRGSLFEASSASCGALSQGQRAARPHSLKGLGGPAGCAEHLNIYLFIYLFIYLIMPLFIYIIYNSNYLTIY